MWKGKCSKSKIPKGKPVTGLAVLWCPFLLIFLCSLLVCGGVVGWKERVSGRVFASLST